MKRSVWLVLVNRVEINLVDEHECADAPCNVANFPQNRLWREHTRWIVKVRDHDEARLRRDTAANLLGIDRPALFFGAPETFHVCSEIIGNIKYGSVRRMFDQNLVSWLDD